MQPGILQEVITSEMARQKKTFEELKLPIRKHAFDKFLDGFQLHSKDVNLIFRALNIGVAMDQEHQQLQFISLSKKLGIFSLERVVKFELTRQSRNLTSLHHVISPTALTNFCKGIIGLDSDKLNQVLTALNIGYFKGNNKSNRDYLNL